ncbi:dTDP-4-amino-4,6-dideoxy-D-galactose acyltransferase [Pantoea cypripedii]|uniref:dTDP-fucosamine acetyltransferase n=1 Tax=Pantoea cypripedii TaxID=55209 RepID=A0A1X1EPN9_PANCY|nr:dTDP-4-amino-4,6-dideoxy-D-galactose acyltransferase [Pantoea cypripedii]MBP2195945.1 dTDP-4-amino-4,6-dideoxy-D-galactose acyltransferase [Pantoea cypripedii]ORM91917.1 TDP-D-fucosamine acetyltransferase [Pantoea cypripedii]
MSVNVSIKPLPWESGFFAVQTARLDPDGDTPLTQALQQPCALWQMKVAAERNDVIDVISRHGFQLVEGEADLAINIKRTERQTGVRIAREAQIPQLRAAAATAFRLSRFRAPWFHADDSSRFYAQWIENAVRGTFDNQCLIACDEQGALQGFVSIREQNDDARIGLLAVLPEAQGKGIGQRLLLAAADWGRVRQLNRLRVATQLSNLAAMRLYLRSGARLESTAYWFYRNAHDPI